MKSFIFDLRTWSDFSGGWSINRLGAIYARKVPDEEAFEAQGKISGTGAAVLHSLLVSGTIATSRSVMLV